MLQFGSRYVCTDLSTGQMVASCTMMRKWRWQVGSVLHYDLQQPLSLALTCTRCCVPVPWCLLPLLPSHLQDEACKYDVTPKYPVDAAALKHWPQDGGSS